MAEAPKDDDKESVDNILRNYLKEYSEKCSELESAVHMTTRKKTAEDDTASHGRSTGTGERDSESFTEEDIRIEEVLKLLREVGEDLGRRIDSTVESRQQQILEALNPIFRNGGTLESLRYERSSDFFYAAKTVLVNILSGVVTPLAGLASGASSELRRHLSELHYLMTKIERYVDKKLAMHTETDASPRTQFATLAITKESKHETIEPLLQEDENEVLKYRLKLPSGVLFKCRQTGLVFKMETDGELEYYSLPWEDRLKIQPWRPAGPLYNINCLQGTLVELQLPHCEISSEKRHNFLRVVHIKDDNLEIMEPKEITESHVVLPTDCLSLFGLITNFFGERNIRALVVLFIQDGTDPLLNALLLPSNTDIAVVQQKRARRIHPRKETCIDINPHCEINTNKRYTLSTDPTGLSVTPKSAHYIECDPNFSSTFTVYCDKVKRVTLTLKDGLQAVWENLVPLEECQRLDPDMRKGVTEDFFQKHKGTLKYRLSVLLEPILHELVDKRVLNREEMEEIQAKNTPFKKNVLLLDMVERKGVSAQIEFCQVLQEMDNYLYKDLAKHESEGPGTPV